MDQNFTHPSGGGGYEASARSVAMADDETMALHPGKTF
jgi:hypothetical protein